VVMVLITVGPGVMHPMVMHPMEAIMVRLMDHMLHRLLPHLKHRKHRQRASKLILQPVFV
jgi:hypothetical protein